MYVVLRCFGDAYQKGSCRSSKHVHCNTHQEFRLSVYVDVSFNFSSGINFLAANAMFHTKPIIYCSDGLCELLGYTKGQLMLKSSTLKILYGSETSSESIESLCLALEETKETEIAMNLYSKEGISLDFYITRRFRSALSD